MRVKSDQSARAIIRMQSFNDTNTGAYFERDPSVDRRMVEQRDPATRGGTGRSISVSLPASELSK